MTHRWSLWAATCTFHNYIYIIIYSDPGLVGPINLTFIRIEYINDDNVTIEQQNITYNISNGREINRLSNKYIY